MAQILVRDINCKVVQRLKVRAKMHGRSLQSEAKMVLERAAGYSLAEALIAAQKVRKSLGRRKLADSSELIREDRQR